MFNLFKKKGQNDKTRLVHKLESLASAMSNRRLVSVNYKIENIINRIDNQYLTISKEQIEAINTCIDFMMSNADKKYQELLDNKCRQIESILDGNNNLSVNAKSEDELYKILGEINSLDANLTDIKTKMDRALGVDKTLWMMLNTKKNILEKKMSILSKNYNLMMKNIANYTVAEDIDESTKQLDTVINERNHTDFEVLKDNINIVNTIENSINDDSNEIDNLFYANYGLEGVESEYDRALENKVVSESTNVPKEKHQIADENI